MKEAPSERLSRWMRDSRRKNKDLAAEVRPGRPLHDASISNIRRGRRRPSIEVALAIERLSATWVDGPIRIEEWARRTPALEPNDAAA